MELVLSGIYQRNEVVDVACTRKVDRLSKEISKNHVSCDNFVMYDVNAKETRKHVMLYSQIFLGIDHGFNELSQRSGIMTSGASL